MVDNWANLGLNGSGKYSLPDSASSISGLLAHLNVDELREVLNDDSKFEELIKDYKGLKDIETDKEMLMASNRSLAEFNLSRETMLSDEKSRIRDRSEVGEKLYHAVEDKLKEMNGKSGCRNVETALALLQAAAAEMEEESEAIADKFLEGDLDVDSFLERFTTRRKLMHLRKVKTDKLSEMVNRRTSTPQYGHNINQTFNASPSFYRPPQPPSLTHGHPMGLPYPSAAVSIAPEPYCAPMYYG